MKKYNNIEEWCKKFECHIITEMITYNEYLEEYDPALALLYCDYLTTLIKLLEKKDKSFKEVLITIINRYALYNFSNQRQYHFLLIYNTVHYNFVMQNLYKSNFPYREDKFYAKAQRRLEKNIKDSTTEYYPASPKEHLVKFKALSEEILKNFDFDHNHQTTTITKIRERNQVIDELIDLIVSDNYANIHGKRKSFHSDMRNTTKTKEFIKLENKIETLNIKNRRNKTQYYKTLSPKKMGQ